MWDWLLSAEGGASLFGYIIAFLTGVVFAAFLALLGRAAFGIARPVSRVLRAALKFFGLKSAAKTRPARAALTGAAARRRADHLTAIEWALRQPSETAGETAVEYDFAEERGILRKHGQAFKWLRIPSDYIPKSLSQPFSEEIAALYDAGARRFFSRSVELHVDETNFYEDEEGGVIAAMFRDGDRRCFYALDQLRRVINGNARRLTLFLSVLSLAATAAAYAAASALTPSGATSPADAALKLAGAGAGIVGVFAIIAYLAQVFYANDQRQNMREFSDFLTRYLSLIANRFREASATASRVIQGDERDSKRLAANAQKWHKIMIWLGMRPFFIESFVRNVTFQIRRNLNYYMVGATALFAVLGPAVFALGAMALGSRYFAAPSSAGLAMVAAVYVFAAAFAYLMIRRRVILEELNQTNWLGYDNLEVGRQMDEVIGKFAEEIGLWRGRFRE